MAFELLGIGRIRHRDYKVHNAVSNPLSPVLQSQIIGFIRIGENSARYCNIRLYLLNILIDSANHLSHLIPAKLVPLIAETVKKINSVYDCSLEFCRLLYKIKRIITCKLSKLIPRLLAVSIPFARIPDVIEVDAVYIVFCDYLQEHIADVLLHAFYRRVKHH